MSATQPLTAAARPAPPRPYVPRRATVAAAAVCLVSLTGFWAAQRAANVSMIDLMVYRAEGWAVRDGHDLYAMRATEWDLPNTYPPFAAILFVPLTWLDVEAMRTAATLVNLALLGALVHLSLRLVGRPHRLPGAAAAFAVTSVAVWCEPVWTTVRYGQINLLLAVLVLWDLTRRTGHRWAGAGIGVAAGIKLTPALFAVLLALVGTARVWRAFSAAPRSPAPDAGHGRHAPDPPRRGPMHPRLSPLPHPPGNPWLRRAAVAAGTFAGTAVLAAIALPGDSRRFWTSTVFAASRVGTAEEIGNQSLRGVLARVLHTDDPGTWWLPTALATAVLGLAVAAAAALAGGRLPSAEAWSVVCCATTALLVSPVSWSHHWVWCVPAVLLLGSEALRRGSRVWRMYTAVGALVFTSYLIWLVPHGPGRPELDQTTLESLVSALYPAAGAALLGLGGRRGARALRPSPGLPGQTRSSGAVQPAGAPAEAARAAGRQPAERPRHGLVGPLR